MDVTGGLKGVIREARKADVTRPSSTMASKKEKGDISNSCKTGEASCDKRKLEVNLSCDDPLSGQVLDVAVIAFSQSTFSALQMQRNNLVFNAQRRFGDERVMYARKHRPSLQKNPVIGGTPITCEEAMALRTAVFGNSVNMPRNEWLRTGCAFREAGVELAYGLKAARNGTRGVLSVVQAHIVRHLLFAKRDQTQRPEQLLKPSATTQIDALWTAISDILWCVGEKTACRVCLPQDCSYVEQGSAYFQDNITERLHLFEFTDLEDLQIFIKRYIYLFQDEQGPGALLLLYSAVFTRGITNVIKDVGEDKGPLVVAAAEEGSHNVVMLLLTGRATPYLHNGVVYVGDEDHYALPQYGVLSRSGVGFLTWTGSPDASGDESKLPGSRLKTPSLPVWVAYCVGHYGVVFNTNRELLCNYHAERRFELHYYTCGGTHSLLSVDTRFNDINGKDSRDDMSAPPLEKLVHTKWEDAHITWLGPIPSFQ